MKFGRAASVVIAGLGVLGMTKTSPVRADVYTWVGTGTSHTGNWTDADWTTPATGTTPVNFGMSTDTAVFSTSSGTVTLSSATTTFVLGITNSSSSGYTISGGTLAIGAGGITMSNTGKDTFTITSTLTGSAPLVITDTVASIANTSNGNTIQIVGDNTAGFSGGIIVPGTAAGPLSLQFDVTTRNFSGLNVLNAAGTGTIEIDASGSSITQTADANQSAYYVIPNNILLNNGAISPANFQIAIGPSSTPSGATLPNTIIYSGAITTPVIDGVKRTADLVVSNDYFGGGGKGSAVFTNINNDFGGKLIINNNGTRQIYEMVDGSDPSLGGQIFTPTTQLVFGLNSTVPLTKPVGAFDMNGHDLTIGSLSSDLGNFSTLGITNNVTDQSVVTGSGVTLTGVFFGYNGGTNHYSTLTINDPANAYGNTVYAGAINDGFGVDLPNALNGSLTGGLGVALTLAASDQGSTTLTGNRDPSSGAPILTYSGPTSVRGGTLYINGALSGTSRVTAYTGGTLAGGGSINGDVTINSGAIIAPLSAASAPGQLTLNGNVNIAAGATLRWALTDANAGQGVGNSFLQIALLNGTTLTLPTSAGAITVSAFGAASGLDYSSSQLWNVASNIPAASLGVFTLTEDPTLIAALHGGTLQLISGVSSGVPVLQVEFIPVAGATNLSWSGPTGNLESGSWDTTATGVSWFRSDGTHNQPFANSTVVNFNDQGSATTSNITIQAAGVQPGLVKFNNGMGSYSFTNASGTIGIADSSPAAPTTLLVLNSGTVTFNSPNTYSGGTVIGNAQTGVGGTVVTRGNGELGAASTTGPGLGKITLQAGGTWEVSNASQSYTNDVVVNNGIISVDPGLTLTLSPNLSVGNSASTDFVVSGSGSLIKTGAGTLAISPAINSGTNARGFQTVGNYSGDTTVSAGVLQFNGIPAFGGGLAIASGGTLVFAQPISYFAVPGNSKTNFDTAYSLFTPTAGSSALAGNIEIKNAITFSFSDGSYSGGGKILVDAGQTTDLGGTIVPGTLLLGSGNLTSGNVVTISNEIHLNNLNLTFTPSGLGVNPWTRFTTFIGMSGSTATLYLNGPITGNANVEFAGTYTGGGAATIVLGASSTYTGTTYIETGGSSIVTLATNNAFPVTTTLVFGDYVNNSDPGYVDLSGFNQQVYGIATNTSSATHTFYGAGGIANSGAPATLTLSGNGAAVNTTFAAPIGGAIALNLDATYTGTLALTHSNTFSGDVTINGGSLKLNKDNELGMASNVTIGTGVLETTTNVNFTSTHTFVLAAPLSTFQVDDSGTTIGGALTGGGGLQKTGTGTLTLTTPSTYGGTANVKAGVIVVADLIQDLPNGLILSATGSSPGTVIVPGGVAPHTLITAPSGYFTPASFNGGKLNLGLNNDMVVPGFGTSSITVGTAMAYTATITPNTLPVVVTTGALTGTEWAALTGTTLGTATFDGHVIAANDLLLRWGLAGDVTFSGTINLDDYLAIDRGYAEQLTGYLNGDFNHDGTINGLDYAEIDANYYAQSGTLADSVIALHTQEFGPAYTQVLNALLGAPSAVPEPASLVLLGAGAMGLLRRRRR